MLTKKRKKKAVFGKLFNTNIKKGDFVEYPQGKVIWLVQYDSKYGVRLHSLGSNYTDRYISSSGKPYPFYRVPNEEAIRFMCLHCPGDLSDHFLHSELRTFFKKHLMEV